MKESTHLLLPVALFIGLVGFGLGLLSPVGTFNDKVSDAEKASGRKILEIARGGVRVNNMG